MGQNNSKRDTTRYLFPSEEADLIRNQRIQNQNLNATPPKPALGNVNNGLNKNALVPMPAREHVPVNEIINQAPLMPPSIQPPPVHTSIIVKRSPSIQNIVNPNNSIVPVPNPHHVKYKNGNKILSDQTSKSYQTIDGNENGDYLSNVAMTPRTEEKRKLIIRGLKRYKESRGSAPPTWVKEFPCRSRYHPDNYIYDFKEGPNIPKRNTDAMNKCVRKGGRCDRCGIYTGDICTKCRRCDQDCECTGSKQSDFFGSTDPRGGSAWSQAQKYLNTIQRFPTMEPNLAPEQYPFNSNSTSKSAFSGPPPPPNYLAQPPAPQMMPHYNSMYGYTPYPLHQSFGYPSSSMYGGLPAFPPHPHSYYPPQMPQYPILSMGYGHSQPFYNSSSPPVYSSHISVNAPDY